MAAVRGSACFRPGMGTLAPMALCLTYATYRPGIPAPSIHATASVTLAQHKSHHNTRACSHTSKASISSTALQPLLLPLLQYVLTLPGSCRSQSNAESCSYRCNERVCLLLLVQVPLLHTCLTALQSCYVACTTHTAAPIRTGEPGLANPVHGTAGVIAHHSSSAVV